MTRTDYIRDGIKDKRVCYTNFGGGLLVKRIYEFQIEAGTGTKVALNELCYKIYGFMLGSNWIFIFLIVTMWMLVSVVHSGFYLAGIRLQE